MVNKDLKKMPTPIGTRKIIKNNNSSPIISNLNTNSKETYNFFQMVYGENFSGFLSIVTSPDWKPRFFPADKLTDAAELVKTLSINKNVYWRVGLCDQPITQGRGAADNTISIPGLWLDVDIEHEVHKRQDLPPDIQSAKGILQRFPLPYTVIINSGHGLYPFILFKKPLIITLENRDQVKKLLNMYHSIMAYFFKQSGYSLDHVSDLSRVLRPPGSINRKDNVPAVPVTILESNDSLRYDFIEVFSVVEELYKMYCIDNIQNKTDYLPQSSPNDLNLSTMQKELYPSSLGYLVLERCNFLKHTEIDAKVLSEPDWYFGMSVLVHTEEGPNLVHELSKSYPKYSFEETEYKIHHAINGGGPTTCKVIQEKCGDTYCKRCIFNGHINSPIVLGTGKESIYNTADTTEPFPIYAIPLKLRKYILEAAEAIRCPIDFIAVPMITLLAVAIGTTRRIQIKKNSWYESTGIYAAIVGDPSSKKSPALQAAAKFFFELSDNLKREYDIEYANYLQEYNNYKNITKSLKESSKKKNQDTEIPDEPKEPVFKRIFLNDTTVEALSEILEKNKRGLAIIFDELASWIRSMNQYKGGKGTDRQFYLSSWSNKRAVCDRKGKKPIIITNPLLSVVGAIPPDILTELRDEKGRSDGFIERILFAYPEPVDTSWTDATISAEAECEARGVFLSLFNLEYDNNGEPLILNFSDEAQDVYKNWYNQLIKELNEADFPEILKGVWGKFEGYCARLSLIIHVIRQVSESAGDYIDLISVKSAIELIEYFKKHAQKVHNSLRSSFADKKLNNVINWIQKHEKHQVKTRDLITYKLASDSSESKKILSLLKDLGYGVWSNSKENLFIFFS